MLRVTLFRICALLAVLLLLPGCRTATPSASSSPLLATTAPHITPRPLGDVISRAELQSATFANAFEAVTRFRPEFLTRGVGRARDLDRRIGKANGDNTDGMPAVYLDGVKQGGVEMLRSIPIAPIYEIRYLSATAASALFGPFHPAGVISVRTRVN